MSKQKKRRRRGFTLAEMLVATLILAMLSGMAAVGTTSALKSRSQTIIASDARMLGFSAMQLLRNELRYGKDIRQIDTSEDDISNYSEDVKKSIAKNTALLGMSEIYGSYAIIYVNSDGHLAVQNTQKDEGDKNKVYLPLSKGSYAASGLKISKLDITINNQVATVTLAVSRGDTTLWKQVAQVALLNPSA